MRKLTRGQMVALLAAAEDRLGPSSAGRMTHEQWQALRLAAEKLEDGIRMQVTAERKRRPGAGASGKEE